MHPADYFEPELLATPKTQYLVGLIKQHKITFEHVDNIMYYFFQIKNWVFTVKQFKRKELNNGWLISNLQEANTTKKNALLKNLLDR